MSLQEQYDSLRERHNVEYKAYCEARERYVAAEKIYRDAKQSMARIKAELTIFEEEVRHQKKVAELAAAVTPSEG